MKSKVKVFDSFSAANESSAKEMSAISPLENFKNVKILIKKVYADELKMPMDKEIHFKETKMKTDKRKYNGGSRPGSGREKMDPEEKIQALVFYVKKKFHDKARQMIQPIVDEINEG